MTDQEKVQRAAQSTRRRLKELAERKGLPEEVKALLLRMHDDYLEPEHPIFEMRYDVGASDWHVTLFKRAVGYTPGQLRLRLCFETALIVLRDTSLLVSEIAPGHPLSLHIQEPGTATTLRPSAPPPSPNITDPRERGLSPHRGDHPLEWDGMRAQRRF